MKHGNFPQALLFAGPKGTGKTSASRIIGAMLNDPKNEAAVEQMFFEDSDEDVSLQEPDSKSDFAQRVFRGQSYVVQEMDAASHRGIDDVRQLRERISLPPQEGKMAVYILDEVHMLTNEAFNALLKILEEPPPHVVFILATTELHKVPPTIVSRCSVVSFHKASLDELVSRLKKILKAEKIEYEPEALMEISRRADGSFRDAVKLAEIAAQSGEITLKEIDNLIGGSALVEVKSLIDLVLAKDEEGLVKLFQDLRQRSFDQDYFYQSLYGYLHQNLLGAIGAIDYEPQLNKKVAQFLLTQIMQVDLSVSTPISFLPLELKLLLIVQKAKERDEGGSQGKLVKEKTSNSNSKSSSKSNAGSKKKDKSKEKNTAGIKKSNNNNTNSGLEKETDAVLSKLNISSPGNKTKKALNVSEDVVDDNDDSLSRKMCARWEEFLTLVQGRNSTLAALLRSGEPESGANGTTKIGVYYQFHKEQLQQPKFKKIIEDCGRQIVGTRIGFKVILRDLPPKADLVDVPAQTETLEALAEETLM